LWGTELQTPFANSFFRESYSRAYGTIVGSQQLSELEEIIEYKKHVEMNDKERVHIKHNLWNKRLQLVEVRPGEERRKERVEDRGIEGLRSRRR
jgi:hypothetical protein